MDSTGLDKSGWVNKKAQVMPSWNPRYLMADPRELRLKYFKERPTDIDTKERGELKLANCTVSVDQTTNDEDIYRFLITTADHRKTFHLEVETQYEMQEWIRVIRLVSDLGVTKSSIVEEQKRPDNDDTFKFSVETLLTRLDTQSTEARRSLDRIAKQKWKAKCRLIELRDEMEEKHRKLRTKQQEMKAQEKSYREDLSQLNQALYVLQQQVRRSNDIQQQVVETFGNNQHPNTSIVDKAKDAVDLCRTLLLNNPNKRLLTTAAKSQPTHHESDEKEKAAKDEDDEEEEETEAVHAVASQVRKSKSKGKSKKKNRARSYSDLTVSKSDVFEDEMSKIIMDTFPQILAASTTATGTGTNDNNNADTDTDTQKNQYEQQNEDVIKIFELYHRYYVEVHLPREMELRKVRTKCEQKYNSLRYVSNKKELARREEDEIDWVMMEMKRAIDRLNKEGVLAPDEKPSKHKKAHKKHEAENTEANHYKPPQNVHRDSSTMIPVLAHRSTWSEASDTIFQLNVARQQQYQATKDLEESLKSRELVKSWYEEKIVAEY
eukprot:CAMPEP_0202694714 /NCGR_PEP_ID=MMETSP1385-20130828/8497_1 /ASSEMBLY_ACC=CAM_ASM_000861 /TAXON_ID=933848 /ORGANISM="Elphidium margaritaceum" /LENGTH=548 /DNA_ID=CAMNT_0049350611 /DNA_START=90 /DNA_END=1736 /DNA_ORIENTATION=+